MPRHSCCLSKVCIYLQHTQPLLSQQQGTAQFLSMAALHGLQANGDDRHLLNGQLSGELGSLFILATDPYSK